MQDYNYIVKSVIPPKTYKQYNHSSKQHAMLGHSMQSCSKQANMIQKHDH